MEASEKVKITIDHLSLSFGNLKEKRNPLRRLARCRYLLEIITFYALKN
jgi:hypothetical protein